jgi:hypothetical protein
MIPKYRNWGVGLSICASALTVLLFAAMRKGFGIGGMGREKWHDDILLLYLGAVSLWMLASVSLAKAKGYGGEVMGRTFITLFLIGYCCPGALFIFPLLGFFLKDKTSRSRRGAHRRRWRGLADSKRSASRHVV